MASVSTRRRMSRGRARAGGRRRGAGAAGRGGGDGGVERGAGRRGRQEPLTGLLQGGVVWHGGKADGREQLRAVGQQGRDAAVVELQGRLQRQAGEGLVLGELLGAVGVRVGRQGG